MKSLPVRSLVLAALFSALLAVCSWISVPAAVPFTLQTFAVFLTLLLLPARQGILAVAVYLFYKDHFDSTEDADTKLGVFCTMPAVRNLGRNFFCEALASWLLVFVILVFSTAENTPVVGMGSLGAFPVTCLIMAIGMSLGGATGYAINPARDLAPRIAHAILPIKGKRDSGWGYSWVPVAGPLVGGALAALCFVLMY